MENVFLGLGTTVRWPVAWARKIYIMVFLQNQTKPPARPACAGKFLGAEGRSVSRGLWLRFHPTHFRAVGMRSPPEWLGLGAG